MMFLCASCSKEVIISENELLVNNDKVELLLKQIALLNVYIKDIEKKIDSLSLQNKQLKKDECNCTMFSDIHFRGPKCPPIAKKKIVESECNCGIPTGIHFRSEFCPRNDGDR